MRLPFVRHELGGVGFGISLLGIIVGGDHLVRVVEDAPDDAHAHHLGRPGARLGLGLGHLRRRLLLFLGPLLVGLLLVLAGFLVLRTFFLFAFGFTLLLFVLVLLLLFFVAFFFVFILAAFGGIEIGTHFLAVQDTSSHCPILRDKGISSLRKRLAQLIYVVIGYCQPARLARLKARRPARGAAPERLFYSWFPNSRLGTASRETLSRSEQIGDHVVARLQAHLASLMVGGPCR